MYYDETENLIKVIFLCVFIFPISYLMFLYCEVEAKTAICFSFIVSIIFWVIAFVVIILNNKTKRIGKIYEGDKHLTSEEVFTSIKLLHLKKYNIVFTKYALLKEKEEYIKSFIEKHSFKNDKLFLEVNEIQLKKIINDIFFLEVLVVDSAILWEDFIVSDNQSVFDYYFKYSKDGKIEVKSKTKLFLSSLEASLKIELKRKRK